QAEAYAPPVSAVVPAAVQAADIGVRDTEPERSEPGHVPLDPISDQTSHAYPRSANSRWLPIYDLLETGNWQRPAIWAAATLACLLLITYAIYHSRSTPVNNEEVVGQTLPAEPANLTEQTPTRKTSTAEKPVKNVSEVKRTRPKSNAEAMSDAESDSSDQPDSNVEEPPPPPLKKLRPQRGRGDQTPEPATTATQPDRRPRVVRTDHYRQPPISTIETILTGLPSDSQRSDARQPQKQ
ncbi:MAG TPA: hypothetical protein VHL50_04680, partial [Pyrinomonadaceae bacterium]|nr:hypothetical protein [Pyrinomonadaceae bacterium]